MIRIRNRNAVKAMPGSGLIAGTCAATKSGRDAVVDLLRAGAILYIVGFWHLCSYVPSLTSCNNRVTRLLTTCVLGLFVFLSGLLLSARYRFDRPGDAWLFYRRRFLRAYPLFLMALAAFYFVGLIDLKPFILSAFLLNLVVNEELVTLWFATMIMAFYGLTPLLLFHYSVAKTAGLVAVLVFVLLMVHLRWGVFDPALVKYLPVFGVGLVAGRNSRVRAILGTPAALLSGIGIFAVLCWVEPMARHVTGRLLVAHAATLGSLPVFLAVGRLFQRIADQKIVWILSYSSYVLYLIHRVVFLLALKLFFPKSGPVTVAWLGGVVLPLTVFACYELQRGYDQVVDWSRI